MKNYKLSKRRRDALEKKYGNKEKKQYNDTLHRLKALKLNLEYDNEYLLYYCLLNKYKINNRYYNFIYNTYLKEERRRGITPYSMDFGKEIRQY